MQPLIILTGPTAVGKTELSIALAKSVNGEIISADSMQVYRRMNIGSAKIKTEEMQGIPHHLIDIREPQEAFDTAQFQQLAKAAIEDIAGRGKIPLLIGGTGFYIQSVLYDIDFSRGASDPDYRKRLFEILQEKGELVLHEKLKEVDPVAAKEIHPNNHKRVMRALEYYHQTGEPISEHNQSQKEKSSPYRFAYFVLNDERQKLYERIEVRIDQMLADGLVEEVQSLQREGCCRGMTSMQGLGYKEILDYLDQKLSYEEAVSLLKRDTRHFAKRQLTWFRREREVIWLNKPDFHYDQKKMLEEMLRICIEKGIIEPEMKEKQKRGNMI